MRCRRARTHENTIKAGRYILAVHLPFATAGENLCVPCKNYTAACWKKTAKELKDLLALLDELMQWLIGKENTLTELEAEPLPDDLEVIRQLIDEHQGFMDNLSSRQPEIDAVCKPMRPKSQAPGSRRASKMGKR